MRYGCMNELRIYVNQIPFSTINMLKYNKFYYIYSFIFLNISTTLTKLSEVVNVKVYVRIINNFYSKNDENWHEWLIMCIKS